MPRLQDKAEEMDLPLYVRHPKTVNIVALLVYMALGMSVMSPAKPCVNKFGNSPET